jgi:hypothetical protein
MEGRRVPQGGRQGEPQAKFSTGPTGSRRISRPQPARREYTGVKVCLAAWHAQPQAWACLRVGCPSGLADPAHMKGAEDSPLY